MRINHVIKTLVVSDFYLEAGLSIFAPIFAVFVTSQIEGGSLRVVGFAAAITQLVKVGFEIPVAKYLDKNHGEYDDFYSMLLGSILISLAPFLYFIATTTSHIYIIHAIGGLGLAFFIPPRSAIFSRHLDKMQENIEWAFNSVAIGISVAGAAALGGILAEKFGFGIVFLIGGVLTLFGTLYEIKIYSDLKQKVPRGMVKPLPSDRV